MEKENITEKILYSLADELMANMLESQKPAKTGQSLLGNFSLT